MQAPVQSLERPRWLGEVPEFAARSSEAARLRSSVSTTRV